MLHLTQGFICKCGTYSSEILPASVIFGFAKFCLSEASPWVCCWSDQVSHSTHSNSSQLRFNIVPGLKEDLLIILKVCVLCLVTQSCPTLCDPMDCSLPGGFSRQEHWSALPIPPPGDLPTLEMESRSPAELWATRVLTSHSPFRYLGSLQIKGCIFPFTSLQEKAYWLF